MFGDDYPRFIELSDLSDEQKNQRPDPRSAIEQRNRMNERYEALFASNRDIFQGARVLDLASHDGRYSFAALKTGAAHVTGVEARQSLIDKAEEAFAFYGQDPSSYRFVRGDLFEVLATQRFDVDVVLCFGFLYHTYRHTELMFRLRQLAPKYLILDTMVTPHPQPTLKLVRERDVEDIRSAAQDPFATDRVLALRPSMPALRMLVQSYGFEIESTYDWEGRLAGRPPLPGLDGYAKGKRASLRCRLQDQRATAPPTPQPAGGWRERVNRTLANATGYELRRVHARR